MDDAKQRTDALKKAFADVILNMTKETAARVLASEKKAARFQQDLATCKDEALQTLLRVKHIMDTKISEKEMILLDQARRIQELEIQLEEAKETIKCLETNLERVNNEMVILKNNAAQATEKEETPSPHTQLEDPEDDDKSMQRSEPVLRSPSYESESVSYKKTSISFCHLQTVTRKLRSLSSNKVEFDAGKAAKQNISDAIVLTNNNCSKGEIKLHGLSTGRRAKRRSMRKARLLTSIGGHVKFESSITPPDPNSSSQKVPEFASLASRDDSGLGCKDGVQYHSLDQPLSPVVNADGPEMSTENGDLKDMARPSDLLIQYSSPDAFPSKSNDHTTSDQKPISQNAKSNGAKGSQGNVDHKQEELPSVNLDDKRRDDCKSVEVGTSLGSGDRFLKYTFRRKRIRGSSNDAAETTDPEKSNPSKKKTYLNEDFAAEPPKSPAGRQSSSDSRRIAQVARQLISLSQKRWG